MYIHSASRRLLPLLVISLASATPCLAQSSAQSLQEATEGYLTPLTIPAGKVIMPTKEAVNLRANPSTTAEIVYETSEGVYLPFLGEDNGWYITIAPDGRKAYISATVARLITTLETQLASDDIMARIEYRSHVLDTDPTWGFESNDTLSFSGSPDDLEADNYGSSTTVKGRITEFDVRYQGKLTDGFITLTEKTEGFHDEWEPVGFPLYIFGGEKPGTLIFWNSVYEKYIFNPTTNQWEKATGN